MSNNWTSKKEICAAEDNPPASGSLIVGNENFPLLDAELWDRRPKGHQFSVVQIGLFLKLVLYAPTSLRAASQALEVVLACLFGPMFAIACANAGRLWLLRLGLYELTRRKEKADDWVPVRQASEPPAIS